MIEERLTDEEFALAQIIQNPVLFRQFINIDNENWDPLEDHERAWTSSTAQYLCMCCGRGVRKTTTVIEMLYYWMINKMFIPGDPGLLLYVPNNAQKSAIFPRIRSACQSHWLINKLVDHNKINVSEGRIDFLNGFSFIMRIAGSEGKETNVIAVHGSRIWVDEAQAFPYKAWLSLENVLRFDIPGHMLWVSGVPNGERTDNVLYKCDVENEQYISYNIPQTMMSWWTADIEYKRRKTYNAIQEDSEDYKHFVLGQHGVPTFSIFDRTRFLKEEYEVKRDVLTQGLFEKVRNDDGSYRIHEAVICPPLPTIVGVTPKVVLGYDVGFSPDPSVLFVMWQDPKTGVWRNLFRLILQRVEYTLQRKTLLYLDQVYRFDSIGIDMGGPGKVVYQELTSDLANSEYKDRNFRERMFPVEFGANMVVALQEDEDDKSELIEKKDNVKRVSVDTLSRWVQQDKKFVFASDDDNLMAELERTKFHRTPSGEPVYKTDDDHQMAAMMCAIMSEEHFHGSPLGLPKFDLKPKLVTAKWLTAV